MKVDSHDQVVFANGEVKNVNAQSYPEIYWALRGGGNNFGIVTRFDLATFEQGQLWGGTKSYSAAAANISIIKALHSFGDNASQDPDAALIVGFTYLEGQYLATNIYQYAKPVENPSILHEFLEIESISSELRFANLTDIVIELKASNPSGLR